MWTAVPEEKVHDVEWILKQLAQRNKQIHSLNARWLYKTSVVGSMDLFNYGSVWISLPYDDIKNETDAIEYPYGTDIARELDRRYRIIHYIERGMGWTPEIT